MSQNEVSAVKSLFASQSILPIIQAPNIDAGIHVAMAMKKGGLNIVEVVLRDAFALKMVTEIKAAIPDLIVGVGTVYNTTLLEDALNAGGDFIVTPATTTNLANALIDCGKPFVPGVSSLSDMVTLLELGITDMKLFPAEVVGGTKLLKAVSSLFGELQFCPTGGINASNAQDYLSLPNVMAVGGTWVSPASAVNAQDWDSISALCSEAAKLSS